MSARPPHMTHIQGMCVPLTDGVSGVPHAVHFHRVGGDAASAQRAGVARYHLHLYQRHRESQGGELSLLPFCIPLQEVLWALVMNMDRSGVRGGQTVLILVCVLQGGYLGKNL